MDKIELTEKQKEVLQKQINGDYSPFFATDEDREALNQVIDMASILAEELDYPDDIDGDLMAWFLGKYQNQ